MELEIKRNRDRKEAIAKGPEFVKRLNEKEFLEDILAHKPRTAGEFVGLIVNLGHPREHAIQILQAEVAKRKSILQELARLQAIQNPDEAALNQMEQFAAEAEDKLWFPKTDEEALALSVTPSIPETVRLHFKAVWLLYDVDAPRDETVQLSTDDFKLSLRRMAKTEAEELHLNFGPHICEVCLERELPDHIRDQFIQWVNFAVQWHKNHPETFGGGPDAPEDVVAYSREIIESTRVFVQQSISVMIWRLAIHCSSTFIHSERGLFWSADGETWERFYKGLHPTAITAIMVPPSFDPIDEVEALIRMRVEEPLGSELLREARSTMKSSLRSALIIGMTAAEVGTKQFIVKLAPQAEWLAWNSPSPPLIPIIKAYLPTLPVVHKPVDAKFFVPRQVYEIIEEGVKARNKAAHQGQKITRDEVQLILRGVELYLHYLDYYAGNKWALDHARRASLNMPIVESKKGKQPKSP